MFKFCFIVTVKCRHGQKLLADLLLICFLSDEHSIPSNIYKDFDRKTTYAIYVGVDIHKDQFVKL